MSDNANGGGAGFLKRTWNWLWQKPSRYSVGGMVLFGFVAGIVFLGGAGAAIEATDSEKFCVSCHEMHDNVYQEYQDSVHDLNGSGVRATCPDCHVPKPIGPMIWRKIRAAKEGWGWLLGTIGTKEKFEAHRATMALSVWKEMKSTDSRECRSCHDAEKMDFEKQDERAADQHEEAFEKGMTCIDCHKGIAHHLPKGWKELAKKNGLMPSEEKSE